MCQAEQNLRRRVPNRPTVRSCAEICPRTQFFRETEVNELDVTILVKHNVLQFHVSMHVALLMQSTKSVYDLSSDELYNTLGKSFILFEDLVKLSSVNERHDKVEPQISLENPFHFG